MELTAEAGVRGRESPRSVAGGEVSPPPKLSIVGHVE